MHSGGAGHQRMHAQESRGKGCPVVLHRSVHAVHAVIVPVRRLSIVTALRVLIVAELRVLLYRNR